MTKVESTPVKTVIRGGFEYIRIIDLQIWINRMALNSENEDICQFSREVTKKLDTLT